LTAPNPGLSPDARTGRSPTPGKAADLLVGVRSKNEPPTRGSRAMYIGIGTIVLILAIIVVVMLLRGRSV